ncbi:MAG: thiamine pyrophosphate-binding protein [Actinomycetia bacterium]|nr:thiamine pyrophosphate-binding protein [Actinomycetes bacterium]
MTKTMGKQALAELLREEGVEYVFGIPGATEIQFMDGLERCLDIRYMLGLHEVVCVGMAEGYARVTGKPGVLNLHTATGMAAASPLLYNARNGRVPLVVTCGQNDSRLLQRDPQLTGDIVGIGRIHAKWSEEIARARDIPTVIRRAFKLATQPPMGPVVVSIPQNLLQEELDFSPAGRASVCRAVRPDASGVEHAVELLITARAPVLIVESGVTRADALDEVVHLAELVGAPVYQPWMADVNFPVTHPQYLGDLDPSGSRAAEVLSQADLLIGIGCPLFAEGFVNAACPVPPATKIIHIDDDPWEIGKNLPTECGLQGDIKATVRQISSALETALASDARERAAQRAAKIRAQKAAMEAAWQAETATGYDASPISIGRLMAELRNIVNDRTVIVDECWSASAALRATLPLERPLSYLRARGGGSIGEGLPVALGVKLGRPDKQVVAVVGDGSAAWSMQTLWTAAHYRIPVTYVIMNNGTYRQVKIVRRAVLGVQGPLDEKHVGMDIDEPVIDFSGLARSLGVEGRRVSDPDQVGDALRSAIASEQPRVVEVMVENRA